MFIFLKCPKDNKQEIEKSFLVRKHSGNSHCILGKRKIIDKCDIEKVGLPENFEYHIINCVISRQRLSKNMKSWRTKSYINSDLHILDHRMKKSQKVLRRSRWEIKKKIMRPWLHVSQGGKYNNRGWHCGTAGWPTVYDASVPHKHWFKCLLLHFWYSFLLM